MTEFKLTTKMTPKGDQPQAIKKLTEGINSGLPHQTLLGVTGSGKTFSMAHVIQNTGKPTLIISHNKTLAAQLYSEFKEFFPNNAVHYFVSYYDYYQPEAYIPQRDIYIEKDASINENLDRLRLAATSALLSRRDVIIVASVSCIYGLGSPEDYAQMVVSIKIGDKTARESIMKQLVDILYERNETVLSRGNFRVRGDTIEIWPAYDEHVIRITMDDDKIATISQTNRLTGDIMQSFESVTIFPAKHFVMPEDKIKRSIQSIKDELKVRLAELKKQNKLVEAQRLGARTNYDIEMLLEVGYCKGIENYSRHLSGRKPGERPFTLMDFFPKDYLVFVDESHVTIPQIRGMYFGDRSRKETLVEYGFRLPSALDNRPMKFAEWEAMVKQMVFVSATPGDYEAEKSKDKVVEQIIRPTGLVDPAIIVKPTEGQVADLTKRIQQRIKNKERVLITTLTKRLAEDLSSYMQEKGIKGRYLHSEIETIERVKILNDLRKGTFDVLVGVNLLREGLDLPEVSLVAIMDADKEGFLRSETSLIQTVGRTARNVNGEVILYADNITGSMKRAMAETDRRRKIQLDFNKKNHITPKTIKKAILEGIEQAEESKKIEAQAFSFDISQYEGTELVMKLEEEMLEHAKKQEFEKAAEIRDLIDELKRKKK
ncbi:MAG: excinuclease ABC subunit UvrB [Planctomycetes bacterium]|nr:excinuclease ABC subunit UvrB [Planctomycetota bacterium]